MLEWLFDNWYVPVLLVIAIVIFAWAVFKPDGEVDGAYYQIGLAEPRWEAGILPFLPPRPDESYREILLAGVNANGELVWLVGRFSAGNPEAATIVYEVGLVIRGTELINVTFVKEITTDFFYYDPVQQCWVQFNYTLNENSDCLVP